METLQGRVKASSLPENEKVVALRQQQAEFGQGIPECGADALRFGLCAYTQQGRDINMDVQRVVAYRHFCNKIWNAFRFALPKVQGVAGPAPDVRPAGLWNRWILSRLAHAVQLADDGFRRYDFPTVTTAIHGFWLRDFCDVYLEQIKSVLSEQSPPNDGLAAETQRTLATALDTALRLTSPFMPFLTEELWHRLHLVTQQPLPADSIGLAAYPPPAAWAAHLDPELQTQ